ncbi:molybdenum cofactor cytidylyltransferase [Sphingomonas jejuensis]|uniref:Molybdenum cofactor cytidylyltransferase n=1 Tax=Sphingomonas jejuensis TaxID=904715 RepID=A0ABX0XKM5_9SPHN|nr:nucleotidyltransferase family protein [Sphingomonas jejuensis]NJC33775.1 molybdenum cofactor cytidylyltransferase [Sphingomonas jejuensis]
MASAADVDVLLLAAGRSRRFGDDDKLLAPFHGLPLALHAARTLASLGCRRLVAVCASDAVAGILEDAGFAIVRNDDPDAGMGHSIALGASALGGDGRTLVALADMPAISAAHLRTMIAYDADMVASEAAGIRSPPALFGAGMRHRLASLSGDRGARDLLATALPVPAPAGTLADVDTPAALSRLAFPSG